MYMKPMPTSRFNNPFAFCRIIGAALLICSGLIHCLAQTNKVAQRPIPSSIVNRALSASIKMYGIDSLSRQQNSAPFSGVVVSADGFILTVAHSTTPGHHYQVIFADGRKGTAKALGRLVVDQQSNLPDIALMKMQGEGPWPFAEMGWSSSTVIQQACFGLSYPETLPFNRPFLRAGHILRQQDDYGLMWSSCIMEPGDSGGPLFDLLGRVIGLHSRIDAAEGINYEVPVDSYRKYWSSLTQPVAIGRYPSSTDPIGTDPQKELLATQSADRPAKLPKTNLQVFPVSSMLDGDRLQVLGTAFTLSNKVTVILSKSSMVADHPVLMTGRQSHPLTVLLRDETTDLVALATPKELKRATPITTLATRPLPDSLLGIGLWSLLDGNTSKQGVLGMMPQPFPRIPVLGSFDAQMREIEGLPTLTKVDSMGAAYRAGLRSGDRILAINGHDVSSALKINAAMRQYSAGDRLTVQYRRDTAILDAGIVLSRWPVRENPHPANHIPGGKSDRRDTFPSVFIHDSRIHAQECGSPIIDSKGEFIGINIARYSHTACLAIPRDVVKNFLSNLRPAR